MERFVVVVFFIALIMAAIFWLPNKLGFNFENSNFCIVAAFIAAVAVVVWAGIGRE